MRRYREAGTFNFECGIRAIPDHLDWTARNGCAIANTKKWLKSALKAPLLSFRKNAVSLSFEPRYRTAEAAISTWVRPRPYSVKAGRRHAFFSSANSRETRRINGGILLSVRPAK